MEAQVAERWLSVQEIANHLGVSKETVYRYLDAKKIPAYKVGKQWKFQASEVDEWVRGEKSTELDKTKI